ncbi:MAG: hypothetical protein C5B49_07080 [Bdellovibrio sp.]|nr:MAG: hypothetical protein C5B49_07080 [Bdellovibrio sp.]
MNLNISSLFSFLVSTIFFITCVVFAKTVFETRSKFNFAASQASDLPSVRSAGEDLLPIRRRLIEQNPTNWLERTDQARAPASDESDLSPADEKRTE